tara:strand:+ start:8663 stop:9649 length:987 start_codon:yes stop_codon:yes gene_type:complete
LKNSTQKIFVAGHKGMVGSAILRSLKDKKYLNIVTKSRNQLDLSNQAAVKRFLAKEKPDQVYLCAAKVGGIFANNTYPAEFIYQNIMIEANVIHQSFLSGVKKLIFLGSSCIYPKFTHQPIKESALLSGHLEPTNEPYAISKILGIKLCESYNRQYSLSHNVDFRSVMPTNLYGIGDNYHDKNSHVIPALIQRLHRAKIENKTEVLIWGSGKPKREFLYVDDMAEATIHVMNISLDEYRCNTEDSQGHINVGFGEDISIEELALKIAKIVEYKGILKFDIAKPDGTPRKILDSSVLKSLGWKAKINLEEGLNRTYSDFLKNYHDLRMK